MNLFLLIRHGSTDWIGRAVAGRLPGVHLNDEGRAQADELVARLEGVPLDAIYASPLERTNETAAPLAKRRGLTVVVRPEITELDFGEWTGRRFDDLQGDPRWQRHRRLRSATRPPHGEMLAETQARMAGVLEQLRRDHPDGTVALFSHGDAIRAALLHALGMPLDHLLRLEISPASVSVLAVEEFAVRLLTMNHTGTLPAECYRR